MIWYVLISIFIVMKNKSSHTVISTAVLVLCSGTLEKQFHTWITSCSHLPHTWSIKTIWPFEKDQACSKCPAGFTDDCEHRPLGCEASFHLTHLGSWAGRRMPHRFFIYREFNPHSLEAALHASPLQRSGNPNLKWLSQVPKMRLSRALNGYWASQEEILLPFAAAASNNDEVVALGAWHIQDSQTYIGLAGGANHVGCQKAHNHWSLQGTLTWRTWSELHSQPHGTEIYTTLQIRNGFLSGSAVKNSPAIQ